MDVLELERAARYRGRREIEDMATAISWVMSAEAAGSLKQDFFLADAADDAQFKTYDEQ